MRVKIVLVGPPKCGKTTVANHIGLQSDERNQLIGSLIREGKPLSSLESQAGVRILEFDRILKGKNAVKGTPKATVELWDCSGDPKFQTAWDVFASDAHGLVVLFNPGEKNQDRELESWHSTFSEMAGLTEEQCLVFAHNPTGKPIQKPKLKLGKQLQRVQIVDSSIELEGRSMLENFDTFVAQVVEHVQSNKDNLEKSIMDSN